MAWGSKGDDTPAQSKSSLSFIGSEVIINGNISGHGDIHLDGTIQGDLTCKTLTLGAGGRINGNISAEKATLAGTVEGTVSAANLIVEKTAQIKGDLTYESVSIETGAHVDGRVSHRAPSDQSALKLVSVAE